jgi:integrative and conjugative element protein (TIGR02256 family)
VDASGGLSVPALSLSALHYSLGESGQHLVLAPEVLRHFQQHRQRHWWQSEAGGQLFARIQGAEIMVSKASGPRPTDRRTRGSYQGDRRAEQREIEGNYEMGLHYVGDWHTHACAKPVPSSRDLDTISDIAKRSSHGLNALALVIVGTDPSPAGICSLLHNGRDYIFLRAAS